MLHILVFTEYTVLMCSTSLTFTAMVDFAVVPYELTLLPGDRIDLDLGFPVYDDGLAEQCEEEFSVVVMSDDEHVNFQGITCIVVVILDDDGVCVCACVCACMRACVRACVCICEYLCACVCVCMRVYVRIYVRMNVCMRVRMYVHMYMCVLLWVHPFRMLGYVCSCLCPFRPHSTVRGRHSSCV